MFTYLLALHFLIVSFKWIGEVPSLWLWNFKLREGLFAALVYTVYRGGGGGERAIVISRWVLICTIDPAQSRHCYTGQHCGRHDTWPPQCYVLSNTLTVSCVHQCLWPLHFIQQSRLFFRNHKFINFNVVNTLLAWERISIKSCFLGVTYLMCSKTNRSQPPLPFSSQ